MGRLLDRAGTERERGVKGDKGDSSRNPEALNRVTMFREKRITHIRMGQQLLHMKVYTFFLSFVNTIMPKRGHVHHPTSLVFTYYLLGAG